MADIVTTSVTGQIGTITLNHPEKRNALGSELVDGIVSGFESLKKADVRVVVLRAAPGMKVWSAGHDIGELAQVGRDPLGWSDHLRVLVRSIEDFLAPVIALIEGTVWGGACEVAMACDILVASPETTFAITPAKLGLPYNITGLLTFMNAVPLPVVKEMLFTAKPIPAERALRLGIVNHVVPLAEIEAFVDDLALSIAANAPLSIAVMKEELRLLASAHAISPRTFERMQGLRRVVYDSADYAEGKRAFAERRKPVFRGE